MSYVNNKSYLLSSDAFLSTIFLAVKSLAHNMKISDNAMITKDITKITTIVQMLELEDSKPSVSLNLIERLSFILFKSNINTQEINEELTTLKKMELTEQDA